MPIAETKNPMMRVAASIPLGPIRFKTFLADARNRYVVNIVRIASGLAFLYHGSAILFGAFGGPGPQGFAAFIHAPVIVAHLAGLAQLFGGLTIPTGILT